MRYTLRGKQGTETFQRIYAGRKWVGRVAKHKSGKCFIGTIGSVSVTKPTGVEAFEEVSAMAMGFKSAAELKAKNAEVRAHNRSIRQRGQHILNEMLHGNFEPFNRMLGGKS